MAARKSSNQMRSGSGLVALLLLVGCGGGTPRPARPPSTTEELDGVAADLFRRLTSGDPAALEPLWATDAQVMDLFDPGFSEVLLDQRRMDEDGGLRVAHEWGAFGGARYTGFCARRVGPEGSDLPGLVHGTWTVGELTIVGRDAAGDWAGLVRDLVRTAGGLRLVRWSVETPRREHFDLESWVCDFSRR
jgi:hypothetical protein